MNKKNKLTQESSVDLEKNARNVGLELYQGQFAAERKDHQASTVASTRPVLSNNNDKAAVKQQTSSVVGKSSAKAFSKKRAKKLEWKKWQ